MCHDIVPGDDPFVLPDNFEDWVGYRLRLEPGAMNYSTLIRKRTKSEKEAIETFFGLLDEYRIRKAHVVATVADRGRNFTIETYTDDPGFFLRSDDPEYLIHRKSFFRCWKSFENWYGIGQDRLTIVDPTWSPIENQPDDED